MPWSNKFRLFFYTVMFLYFLGFSILFGGIQSVLAAILSFLLVGSPLYDIYRDRKQTREMND
jgi:hypothetical protein